MVYITAQVNMLQKIASQFYLVLLLMKHTSRLDFKYNNNKKKIEGKMCTIELNFLYQ